MRRDAIILLVTIILIAGLSHWSIRDTPPTGSDGVVRAKLFRFENDEGNYNDGYAEPGISYIELSVTRDSTGLRIADESGKTLYTARDADEAIKRIKSHLTPLLTSYNPRTGKIEDVGHHGERGGDQFQNFERRLRPRVPCLRDELLSL